MTNHVSSTRHQDACATAAVCANLELHGGRPGADDPDTREIWDEDEALAGIAEAFALMTNPVTQDGTQLEDERENLLWSFVNTFHVQVQRLERASDAIEPKLKDLIRQQDGSEIGAFELERLTERARNLNARRDAFEKMRDFAADTYEAETGSQWRPRRGSHTSRTGHLTSAAIDARDFMRARDSRKTQANLPEGTLIAVAGGKETRDLRAVWTQLDRVKAKHTDMVLVHGGGPGAELAAARWAENNAVHQIVCKPDWDKHGRAAPFRRNDDLLNLLPKGVVAFPGSGITGNLVDKARQIGIPVHHASA